MMKKSYWKWHSFCGAEGIGVALSYPYSFLQKESEPDYLEAKQAYQDYVQEHKNKPQDLGFLPKEIRQKV